jgi:GntR family transcriptional regulator, rspAB operon transcriptional repressor
MAIAITSTATLSRLDIVQGILDLLARGDLRANEMTSENELARKLDLAGRTPALREALALLARDGIVQPLPQRGYLVKAISSEDCREILRLRNATLRIVVERVSSKDLSGKLDRANQLLSELAVADSQQDSQRFVNLEGRLCCELARLSTLFTATQVIGAWSDQLRVFNASSPLSKKAMRQIHVNHSNILECLNLRERDGALKAVDSLSDAWLESLNDQEEVGLAVDKFTNKRKSKGKWSKLRQIGRTATVAKQTPRLAERRH